MLCHVSDIKVQTKWPVFVGDIFNVYFYTELSCFIQWLNQPAMICILIKRSTSVAADALIEYY